MAMLFEREFPKAKGKEQKEIEDRGEEKSDVC